MVNFATSFNLGYTGQYRDQHTGLQLHGVRWYDVSTGRWLSEDPGGFIDGPNLYVYSRNNPVNLIDPSGYDSVSSAKGPASGTNAAYAAMKSWTHDVVQAALNGQPVGYSMFGGSDSTRPAPVPKFSNVNTNNLLSVNYTSDPFIDASLFQGHVSVPALERNRPQLNSLSDVTSFVSTYGGSTGQQLGNLIGTVDGDLQHYIAQAQAAPDSATFYRYLGYAQTEAAALERIVGADYTSSLLNLSYQNHAISEHVAFMQAFDRQVDHQIKAEHAAARMAAYEGYGGGLIGGVATSVLVDTPQYLKDNSNYVIESTHLGLDLAGMIPVVGNVADGVNAGLYAVQGRYAEAGLSLTAAIPVIGQAATAGKLSYKGVKYAGKAAESTLSTSMTIGRKSTDMLEESIIRVTQFYDPKRGEFGPAALMALVTSPNTGVARILDGPLVGIPTPRTHVSPLPASQQGTLSRLLTGRGSYRHYVEFDVHVKDLQPIGGLKGAVGLGHYQQCISGSVNLSSANAKFGKLGPNYGQYAIYAGIGISGGYLGYEVLTQ